MYALDKVDRIIRHFFLKKKKKKLTLILKGSLVD
jgi:hypothetical protein